MTVALIAVPGPAQALQSPQDGVVSANPADHTPHVLDGDVYAVAEVGDTIVLGGRFTQARNAPEGSPVVARSNLLAFNKATGVLSQTFVPAANDIVRSLVPAADGTSVYVGGQFGKIDGRNAFKIAQLDVHTGQRVAGFSPPRIDAAVMDVRLSGDRLFLGGKFTVIDGLSRTYLAELSAQTGALRPDLNLAINTPVWSGDAHVYKTDVTPDGTRMAVIGNFRSIGGQARTQVAMLDLTTTPVSVMSWASPAFDIECRVSHNTGFDVRDVDFSPDGSYFVIGTTGGQTAVGAVCDGVSRWETSASGPGQQPTWLALTGGDSVYAVATSGAAVYAGGHFRWFNNPVYDGTKKGPGAVDREGLAALDPVTGVPLTWNPGRDRGHAVWDLVATPDGLYVGNDTEQIGRYEYHARIAYFPLAGGTPVPQPATLALPVDAHLIAPAAAPDSLVRHRGFTGTTAGPAETLTAAGIEWAAVRGAFVADGALYAVRTDKTMVKRAVSGATYGAAETVNLNGLTAFADELPNVTSMFYAEGRLYYTLSGKNALYMRFFTVESDIVGATRYTVTGAITGVNWRTATGAFVVQGELYLAKSASGDLSRVAWVDRAPVPGTAVTVSGPAIDGIDWRSAGLFVRPATATPTVEIQQSCVGTRCLLSGVAEDLGDASVTTWSWDFGDGSTGPGQQVEHDFAPGTHDVTLTVTTNEDVTVMATTQLQVENAAPVAAFTVECAGLECSVDASDSSDPDGSIVSYDWDFGDGATADGSHAAHGYAAGGTQTVTLVVTDQHGATGSTTVDAEPAESDIAFVTVAANTAQVTAVTRSVVVPAAVVPGDTLVLFWSANANDASALAPAGWTSGGTATTAASTTSVWTRTTQAGDPGSAVVVTSTKSLKADLVLAVYRGAGVSAVTVAAETVTRADHSTPSAPVAEPGSWAVSYWADKSAATTGWTVPAGTTARHVWAGSGAGHVAEAVADSGHPIATGTTGGVVGTATSAQKNATMVTVVLAPGG